MTPKTAYNGPRRPVPVTRALNVAGAPFQAAPQARVGSSCSGPGCPVPDWCEVCNPLFEQARQLDGDRREGKPALGDDADLTHEDSGRRCAERGRRPFPCTAKAT